MYRGFVLLLKNFGKNPKEQFHSVWGGNTKPGAENQPVRKRSGLCCCTGLTVWGEQERCSALLTSFSRVRLAKGGNSLHKNPGDPRAVCASAAAT